MTHAEWCLEERFSASLYLWDPTGENLSKGLERGKKGYGVCKKGQKGSSTSTS